MYLKNKISVPIWCHDTSTIMQTKQNLGASSQDIELKPVSKMDTPSSNYSMVTFTSEYPELVKQRLAINIGLGTKVGSLNMIPVTISKRADTYENEQDQNSGVGQTGENNEPEPPHPKQKEKNAFFASIQSRLVVEQVVQTVRGAATFSFDYLMLVLVAACLAGVGLATNNTVVIVASMLVSPIMGPILAITFGTMIEKSSLVHQGIINEVVSLVICVMVGFIGGWILIGCGAHTEWTWPTSEMAGRGTVVGILTGIAIATPSGVGVALSILSDNTSSLVGVAISASLLPPAVNAGMMWAYAIFIESGWKGWMLTKGGQGIEMNVNATVLPSGVSMQTPNAIAWAGFISLVLTLLNIALIIIIACAMFWCKSVVKYEGESSGWQSEYKKYMAANFIVRNDKKGKALAKRAAFVAKLATGMHTPSRSEQVANTIFCCGCFQKKNSTTPKYPNTNRKGLKLNTKTRSIEDGSRHVNTDMTPHLGARPVATTIFDLPTESIGEGSPDLFPEVIPHDEVHKISNAVTMGHKTLSKMFSGVDLHNTSLVDAHDMLTSGTIGGGSTTSLRSASTVQKRRRKSFNQLHKHIGVGKSLFATVRNKHSVEAEALEKAARDVALLEERNNTHRRIYSHAQYEAMEGIH
jgi:uncharacterized hydrophobic protein (TIGR00271 family)